MYFVGIDISKFKHDCSIVDYNGEIVVSSWSFSNDHEGFSLFKDILDNLEGEIRIGFESTGHYTDNIRLFHERDHFSFLELNPLLISRFNNSKSLRRTKSDTINAALVAQYLMTIEYKPNPPTLYHIEALKSLTRFRDTLVKFRSRQLVELTNILDKVFPEFKPFFNNRFSVTAIYIISNYQTPECIANMNSRSFELIRKKSKGKFTMAKFIQLKELAKNTIGTSSDYLIAQMNTVIDIYSQLDSKICDTEFKLKISLQISIHLCSLFPALVDCLLLLFFLSMVILTTLIVRLNCFLLLVLNPVIINPAFLNTPVKWLSMVPVI